MQIAHESIYADLPTPLPPSSSIPNSDHFHLDVIAEVDKIWSNANIKIVQEGTSAPHPLLHGYSHYVYYTASSGSVTFRMEPLPTSCMAALHTQPPSHRQGDQGQPMPFPEWFAHLLQVSDLSHLQPESSTPTSYSCEVETVYPPESTGTDWKFPCRSAILPLSIIKSYLTESLLNASEPPRRLFFGLEDGLKCTIGFHVPNVPEFAKDFAHECLASEIFPSLRAEWFKLRFYEVSDSIPSKWNEKIMATTINPDLLPSAFLLSRGRAASLCPQSDDDPNEQIQLLVPKSIYDELKVSDSNSIREVIDKSRSISKTTLRSSWGSLRNAHWTDITQLSSDIWTPRFVLEVELADTRYCGSFFRTGRGVLQSTNALRLCFPFPHPHPPKTAKLPYLHPYTGLDPCAIWLRARAGVQFDLAISELFFSPLFRKVIITDPTCDIEHSLRHYLLGRPLDNFETIERDNTSLYSFRSLPIPTPYPRLIVASLSSLQVIYEIVKSEDKSLWFILLLVDANMQNCWSSVKDALRMLFHHSTVVDTRALIAKQDLFPDASSGSQLDSLPTSSTSPAATSDPAITFDPIPTTTCSFVASSTVDNVLKAWFLRQTPSDPPRWELLRAGRIFFTEQAQRLDKEISAAWTSQAPLQVVPIHKVFPASGATCLLRSVAYKQSKHATILWISKADRTALSQNYTRDLDMAIASTYNRVLVCTDELGGKKASKLLEALQRLTSLRPLLRIIWLHLRAFPVSALTSNSKTSAFVVSPFVESSDILPLASTLKVLGNETALDVVSNTALTSSRVEDRHMFVFVLAATRGVCIPIEKWVGQIYNSLAKFGKRLLDVALSFAFVSAFAVDHNTQYQCVSDEPLDIDPSLIQGSFVEAMTEFRKLFPSTIPSSLKSSTCLHPFLARFFLSARFELYWRNEYLNWQSLHEAWQLTVSTLSRRERCDTTLRNLLSERGRLAQFSPLIIEAWSSTSNLKAADAVQEIKKQIIDVLPDRIMGLHKHILLSRLFRCAAQQTPDKPTPLIARAIDEATAAQEQIKDSTNPGEKFTASQNLAIMHGVAYSINPQQFNSSGETCDGILRQLYHPNPNPVQLDDLILMGRKWCSSDYWQQQQLSTAFDDPDDVNQVIVRGWSFDAANARFRLFSERNVKKLTRTKKKSR